MIDEILRTASLQRTAKILGEPDIRLNVPSFKRATELMLVNNGKCTGFDIDGCDSPGTLRRQNTAYANDDLNWAFLCDDCQRLASEYWKGMWDDYYQNCM